jgi:hypothetical protein
MRSEDHFADVAYAQLRNRAPALGEVGQARHRVEEFLGPAGGIGVVPGDVDRDLVDALQSRIGPDYLRPSILLRMRALAYSCGIPSPAANCVSA